jgi:predicted RND superfamily exporter protein
MIERYINWVISHKKLVLFFSLLIALILSFGLPFSKKRSDFRVYLGERNPDLIAFEQLEEKYSKQNGVFIYIEALDGTVFTKEGLKLIEELTDVSWTMPYVTRVDSIQNFQYIHSEADTLDIN